MAAPRDPSTYSWFDLPVAPAEAFLKAYNSETKPSLTHLLLHARNLYRRSQTDVFITAPPSTAAGKELSGFVLRDVPCQSLGEIVKSSETALGLLRRLTMSLEDVAHDTLNVSLRKIGIPDDRFGSVIISNFGVLGIDNALMSLSSHCRCLRIVGVGRTRPMPVVQGGGGCCRRLRHGQFYIRPPLRRRVHDSLIMRRFQKNRQPRSLPRCVRHHAQIGLTLLSA